MCVCVGIFVSKFLLTRVPQMTLQSRGFLVLRERPYLTLVSLLTLPVCLSLEMITPIRYWTIQKYPINRVDTRLIESTNLLPISSPVSLFRLRVHFSCLLEDRCLTEEIEVGSKVSICESPTLHPDVLSFRDSSTIQSSCQSLSPPQ